MPRKFVSQGKLQTDRTSLEEAFKHRVETGCSIRNACKQFGVKVMTLQDAFSRSKRLSDGKTFVPLKQNSQKVFTQEQEDSLSEYARKIAKMSYGLPVGRFRSLAYEYAVACGSGAIPPAWEEDQMATRDWYYSYISRHPELILKTPEGMSVARAIAFNRTSVEIFFSAYTEAMEKYQFQPDHIFNLDESSLSTMMKPVKVVCERGQPVASQISRERETMMTFVGIISAGGNFIPPVFIIPRKCWNDSLMRGSINGSMSILHQNGLMNAEGFLQTLEHIQRKTYCSPDNKILLIMDNAECHINIHSIQYATQHGIIIVTLPPHTTAKLQPLDVSVFGPFKSYLKSLQNDFHLMNPNTHITEYMLPDFACKAWIRACTPANIFAGFSATGIWPINCNIFPDEAFAGAEVSERPPPQNVGQEGHDLGHNLQTSPPLSSLATPKPSTTPGLSTTLGHSTSKSVTLESSRPFPKAAARPLSKARKKERVCILTENQEAVADLQEKEEKRKAKENKTQIQKAKKQRQEERSCKDEDDPVELRLNVSSEYSNEVEEDQNSSYPFVDKEPEVGDFVLVELELEKGQIVGVKFKDHSSVCHNCGESLIESEHDDYQCQLYSRELGDHSHLENTRKEPAQLSMKEEASIKDEAFEDSVKEPIEVSVKEEPLIEEEPSENENIVFVNHSFKTEFFNDSIYPLENDPLSV